jgi:hypothetical protein
MISIKMHVAMTVTFAMWSADGAKPPMESGKKKKKKNFLGAAEPGGLGVSTNSTLSSLLNRRRKRP